jgi:N-acetylglutamate synthase-like GNAT family acetyltransferase
VAFKIIKADRRHRRDIGRLIREAKIGSGSQSSIPAYTWVAKVGNEIVGYAGLDLVGDRTAILHGIAVKREFRHQGIGSALINRRMEFARQRGISVFALVTMYYLFNFYKKRGFKTCPRGLLPDFLKNYPQFTAQRYKKCAVMVNGISLRRHD